jgi:hypothetical protein
MCLAFHETVKCGGSTARAPQTKKADVVEHARVFHHVGLLSNGPPESAGCPFFSHPTTTAPARSQDSQPIELYLGEQRMQRSRSGALLRGRLLAETRFRRNTCQSVNKLKTNCGRQDEASRWSLAQTALLVVTNNKQRLPARSSATITSMGWVNRLNAPLARRFRATLGLTFIARTVTVRISNACTPEKRWGLLKKSASWKSGRLGLCV